MACRRKLVSFATTPKLTTGQQARHLTLQSSQTANLFREYGIPVVSSSRSRPQHGTANWHLAMTIDRERYCPTILLAHSNGHSLGEISKSQPNKVTSFPFLVTQGITPDLVAQISKKLDAPPALSTQVEGLLQKLFKIFTTKDATHLELTPLSITSDSIQAAHGEAIFDDAASKRQEEIFSLRDPAQEVAEEVEAEKHGLVYVRMDGNVGNVVNGAGLAMATNDAIALHGGQSANFLDGGGQATKETMIKAFDIILKDERVTAILVNIYGGITNGVMIAESIIGAAGELGPLKIPVVVRLQGTNSAEGLKLLEKADLGLHVEADFGEAARKAVELAGPYRS